MTCFLSTVLCTPQHVHIAYGDSLDQIVIVWATKGKCSTQLEFGTSQWQLDQRASGTSAEFWEQNFRGLHNLHRVKLTVSVYVASSWPLNILMGCVPFTYF